MPVGQQVLLPGGSRCDAHGVVPPLHAVVLEEHAVDALHALRHTGGAIRHGHGLQRAVLTDHAEDLSQLLARHLVPTLGGCVLEPLERGHVCVAGVPEVSGTCGQYDRVDHLRHEGQREQRDVLQRHQSGHGLLRLYGPVTGVERTLQSLHGIGDLPKLLVVLDAGLNDQLDDLLAVVAELSGVLRTVGRPTYVGRHDVCEVLALELRELVGVAGIDEREHALGGVRRVRHEAEIHRGFIRLRTLLRPPHKVLRQRSGVHRRHATFGAQQRFELRAVTGDGVWVPATGEVPLYLTQRHELLGSGVPRLHTGVAHVLVDVLVELGQLLRELGGGLHRLQLIDGLPALDRSGAAQDAAKAVRPHAFLLELVLHKACAALRLELVGQHIQVVVLEAAKAVRRSAEQRIQRVSQCWGSPV